MGDWAQHPVPIHMVIGKQDTACMTVVEETSMIFANYGIPFTIEYVKDLGHSYPEDLDGAVIRAKKALNS